MNWDWDKLQEKRQHQQGWNAGGKGGRNDDSGNRNSSDDTDDRNRDNSGPRKPAGRSPLGGGRDPLKSLSSFRIPGAKWWLLGLVVLWLLSGIYIVRPDEAGVVLRFGKYVRTTPAGPHYHAPFPIEQVVKPKVSMIRQLEVGYRPQAGGSQQGREQPMDTESSMLTGDENVVLVQFNIQYNIRPDEDGPVDYLFNVTQPDEVVKKAAEAAMREVIGKSTLESALTVGRAAIQDDVTGLLQDILDSYRVGIHVVAVQMQSVQPPHDVRDAFKDVASAREDKEKVINDAEAYRRDILPKAQGLAAQIVNEAEAYRQTRIRNAEGEASRFLAVLEEYNKAQDVTRKRLLFETMEDILSRPGMEKLILPSDVARNVLPLLPLDGRLNPDLPSSTRTGDTSSALRSSPSTSGTSATLPQNGGTRQASPPVDNRPGADLTFDRTSRGNN